MSRELGVGYMYMSRDLGAELHEQRAGGGAA